MIRRREFLTGAAALAGMTSQAEAFGFGQQGAGFSHSGAVLGRAGTSGPVSLAYEQIVGSNARNAKATYTTLSTTTRLETRRLSVLGGQGVGHLTLAYANYWVDATGAENKTGNAYTLEAAIEIPTAPNTNCVRVTFAASNTVSVADGAALQLSDQIPASAFGYTTGSIPAGTQIFIHDSVLVTAGQLIPIPSPYTPSTGEASVQNNNAGSQVMTTGVPTGTEVNLQSPLIAVLGAFMAPEVSIGILGDSIADFSIDTNSSGINGTSGGMFVRAMWGVNSRNIPWVNLARSSSNMATASAGMSRRLKTLMYCTHLVCEGGTNDLSAGTSAAVTQTALQAMWGIAKQIGISRVDQMLIIPRTASTDSWATAVNQTPVAGFTVGAARDTLNTALTANVGSNGLDGVIDVPSALADAGTPSVWKSPSYTTDGIHPAGTTALNAGAAVIATRFATYVGAASAIASSVAAETTAIVSAFTTPPTAARKATIDFYVKCLKGYGLWSGLDRFYAFAGADSQAALVNWKNPSANAALVGSPVFVADRGFTGDGVGAGIDTQFTPSGSNYTQNSAQVTFYSLSVGVAANNNNRIIGNLGATTPRTVFNPRAVGNVITYAINASFGTAGANSNTDGQFVVRRTAAGAVDVSRNGATIQSDTTASTGLPTSPIQFLHDGATYSTGIQGAVGTIGVGLGSVQNANLRTGVLLPYLQDVGAQ